MRVALSVSLLAAAVSITAGCASRDLPGTQSFLAPKAAPDGRVHLALEPIARFGPASGFWQTPRGGAPGSTSNRRPTFHETGVTSSEEYGVTARADYGRHRLEASYARQVLADDGAVLQEDLVSQASSFPAGTLITSDSAIDWAALRYSYLFEASLSPVDRVQLRPGVGIRAAQLHHVLDGSNGSRVNRHHGPWMPDLTLDWSWRPRNRGALRFSGRVGHSLTVGASNRQHNRVFEVSGRATVDLHERGSIFVETGFRSTSLRDDQPQMQNHLDLDFGPWIGLGGSVRF